MTLVEESPYLTLWWRGETVLPIEDLAAWTHGQRLLPLLAWRAARQDWALPAPLIEAARRVRYRTEASQVLAAQQLQSLSEIARRSEIPIVVVKGAVVAQTYPEPWMRPYADVDLLIPQSAVPALLDAVREAGYRVMADMLGDRGWHLPPLQPGDGAGLKLEIHTSLAHERGQDMFAYEAWAGGLRPWPAFPGLWLPDPVDHALYLIHHAAVHHGFTIGGLPLADLKFWTLCWDAVQWDQLAAKAEACDLQRAVGIFLALAAWFWREPWPPEVTARFPLPTPGVLATAQRIVTGELAQKMPFIWRDLSERNLRGVLAYANLVLFGDPALRQGLPLKEKVLFYLRRPFRLLRNHGPTLWRLVRGDRRTRNAWYTQQELQEWMHGD